MLVFNKKLFDRGFWEFWKVWKNLEILNIFSITSFFSSSLLKAQGQKTKNVFSGVGGLMWSKVISRRFSWAFSALNGLSVDKIKPYSTYLKSYKLPSSKIPQDGPGFEAIKIGL